MPTLNRAESLRKCLDSLLEQTYPNFEIVIVDGGSTDNTLTLLEQYPVNLVRQVSSSSLRAYDLGVKHSKGEIIAFIDDDAVADENWLTNIVMTYQSLNNVGCVGGKIIDQGPKYITVGNHRIRWRSIPILSFLLRVYEVIVCDNKRDWIGHICKSGVSTINFDKGSSITKVDAVRGVNMSFRKTTLMKIGSFAVFPWKEYFGFEDDACLRTKKIGQEVIYNPKAIVYHRSQARSMKWRAYSEVAFFFKNLDWSNPDYFLRFIIKEIFWLFNRLYEYSRTKNKEYLNAFYETIAALVSPPLIFRAIHR